MAADVTYTDAIGRLREALTFFKAGDSTYDGIVAPREQVFARYQPIFSKHHIPQLSKDEFTSFLYLENNRHWSGLYRKGLGAANDMQKLREALSVLLNEDEPIWDRFPRALALIDGFGKGIATGILTVAYPKTYGVWNNTSEAGLREVGLWPSFERGEGLGRRYEKINNVLLQLSSDLGVDLWTLDAVWWLLLEPEKLLATSGESIANAVPPGESFALERQLEEFLLENWNRTPLAKEWVILSTPEDPEAGNQYPTDVGRIDVLAKHKLDPRYLVVELKRHQTADQTVGQALRYVGWVKKHLAKDNESVEALIIAHEFEEAAQYAVATLPHVGLMTYEIEFRLKKFEA
jgi:hypothetical protein